MTTATATPTPDYDEIVRVVQLYLDGWNGGVDKLKEAFHEDAWIFFTDADGKLHKDLLTERFERWAAATGRRIKGRFLSVTQAGDGRAFSSGSTTLETYRVRGWTCSRCCASTVSRKSRTRPPRTPVGARGRRTNSPSVETIPSRLWTVGFKDRADMPRARIARA